MAGSRSACLGLISLTAALCGCSIAPRDFFRSNQDAAPLVRARSLGMGQNLPDSVVVPTLLARLDDPDAVVRMAAHEELRLRSGKDFGYAPWADPPERAAAVHAWKQWWAGQRASLASSHSRPDPNVVAAGYAEPIDRRGRRRFFRRRSEPVFDGSVLTTR